MTTRCVIVKDIDQRRLFWCETGFGLDWLDISDDVWVYESKQQAQDVYRAVKMSTRRGDKIVPYDDIRKAS